MTRRFLNYHVFFLMCLDLRLCEEQETDIPQFHSFSLRNIYFQNAVCHSVELWLMNAFYCFREVQKSKEEEEEVDWGTLKPGKIIFSLCSLSSGKIHLNNYSPSSHKIH